MIASARAKVLADLAAKVCGREYRRVAHIYDDGYILYLPVAVDGLTEKTVKMLRRVFPVVEEAQSSDGPFVTVVLPCEVSAPIGHPDNGDGAEIACIVFATDAYHDHRESDYHLIDDAVHLALRGGTPTTEPME